MDKLHYIELTENLERLADSGALQEKTIYLFGYCNATEVLADLLVEKHYQVAAILDNNPVKWHSSYRGIPISAPEAMRHVHPDRAIVCIAARAYESMASQLRKLGYGGQIERLVDYDTYAAYSLSEETIREKQARVKRGMERMKELDASYPGYFRILCPFPALGDVYYAMAYLPHFLEKKNAGNYMVAVIGGSCAAVVKMFGGQNIVALRQAEMDELVQAAIYTEDPSSFIAHHDRPYVVNLAKALHIKKIPLEMLYRCGVYGLPRDAAPCSPRNLQAYGALHKIKKGRTAILAPAAKSVTNIPHSYWEQIIAHYKGENYQVFSNVAAGEEPLAGTEALDVPLPQIQSAAEQAGTFIGIRSGLCDVLKEASCKKIALYPDRYYSDTRWTMEEIYHLDGWENIVVP